MISQDIQRAFVEEFLPLAGEAERLTARADGRMLAASAITQWALETGWGTSALCRNGHNLAGIRGAHGFATFASFQQFVVRYAQVLLDTRDADGRALYAQVLQAADQGVEAQLEALGRSPWDAGHYGDPPGAHLIALYRENIAPLLESAPRRTTVPLEVDEAADAYYLSLPVAIGSHSPVTAGWEFDTGAGVLLLNEGTARAAGWSPGDGQAIEVEGVDGAPQVAYLLRAEIDLGGTIGRVEADCAVLPGYAAMNLFGGGWLVPSGASFAVERVSATSARLEITLPSNWTSPARAADELASEVRRALAARWSA
jgi:hypothetical protein